LTKQKKKSNVYIDLMTVINRHCKIYYLHYCYI